jgi:predicted DNA-binding transcriptional regulator YafY
VSTSPQRQLRILQILPRAPRKTTIESIASMLRAEGIVVHTRTVRRDLEELSQVHPLVCDDRSKPHGWAWAKGAAPLLPPTLDPHTALAFKLVEEHATALLPSATMASLAPYFDQASRVVAKGAGEALRRWPAKIRILPPGMALRHAASDPAVLDVVYRAVFEERLFKAAYRNASGQKRTHVVNPLALVFRGAQRYLVCTLKRPDSPIQLALSRIEAASILEENAVVPETFDLDTFIRSGSLDMRVDSEMLALAFRVRREVGGFLSDTRLGDDQRVREDGEWLEVEVTMPSTRELRRWLLGFGADLEVLRPSTLRFEIEATARQTVTLYRPAARSDR